MAGRGALVDNRSVYFRGECGEPCKEESDGRIGRVWPHLARKLLFFYVAVLCVVPGVGSLQTANAVRPQRKKK